MTEEDWYDYCLLKGPVIVIDYTTKEIYHFGNMATYRKFAEDYPIIEHGHLICSPSGLVEALEDYQDEIKHLREEIEED